MSTIASNFEQIIDRVKTLYPGDLDTQATAIVAMVKHIEERFGSETIKHFQTKWRNYDVIVTMFLYGENVYALWELYQYGGKYATGVENMGENERMSRKLIFSSKTNITESIISEFA